MTYCPIYKGQCPENIGECTFWAVTIIPSHRTKKCQTCNGMYEDCDWCDGIVDEKRIEGCTLKRELKK